MEVERAMSSLLLKELEAQLAQYLKEVKEAGTAGRGDGAEVTYQRTCLDQATTDSFIVFMIWWLAEIGTVDCTV